MPLALPIHADAPHYAFDCPLDGTIYHFDFDWNDRDNGWYLGISTVDGDAIVLGRRLSVGYSVLDAFADPRLPTGLLIPVDTANTDTDPGVNELGTRVQLVYYSAAELATVLAGG